MMKYNLQSLLQRKIRVHMPAMLFAAFLISLNACKVALPSTYFKTLQKDTTLSGFVSNDFESKIIKGDRLSIAVSSINPAEDLIFNGTVVASTQGATGGYTVQQDGTVILHRLGAVKAEGFTRKELSKKIETGLLAYTKEPLVAVNYLNHKVTIMGEVAKPQVLSMPEEQISMIDALILSGDITPTGKKNGITVIREEGTEKKVKHLNLEDHSIFSSPWYYVKPNDIIIVSADNDKYVREQNRQRFQNNLALVSSVVSLVLILLSRIIK